jgi:hypothetical protein
MQNPFYPSVLLSLLFATSVSLFAQTDMPQTNANKLVNSMLHSIEQANTLSYKIKAWERIEGEMFHTENDVLIQNKPFKVYMKQWVPDKGIEVLYVEGERDGMALINPAGFPYVNVKLDPLGWRMRENHHHTIFESGFRYMANIIQQAIEFAGDRANEFVTVEEGILYEGINCDRLTINNSTFSWKKITAQENISMHNYANNNFLSAYMIINRNADLKLTTELKKGAIIEVPNTYAKKVVLYIDRTTSFPVLQEIYDEDGLFEKYKFLFLNTNPDLKETEFTSSNEAYDF